jgi:D-threonate/D-erythronate kinase
MQDGVVTSSTILIGADDRTGALEAAGAVADAVRRRVAVVVGVDRLDEAPGDVAAVVVDIGTRHEEPADAARRAVDLDTVAAGQHVHKIDSTLRGNWAHELVARSASGARPVLLVPALPALGRTCRDGLVLVDGRPVADGPAGRDPIAPATSSRPAELLASAGVHPGAVVHLTPASVGEWLLRAVGIAVCDASTDHEIQAIAEMAAGRPDVLLAGTSATASAAVACSGRRAGRTADAASAPATPTSERTLVVCGSLHPLALEQVARAVSRGAITVVASSMADRFVPDARGRGPLQPIVVLPPPRQPGTVDLVDAAAVARELARTARELEHVIEPDVLVVIGGDTAAAVLGHDSMVVEGTIVPGSPWGRRSGHDRPVITRAGGFGGPDALVELLWGTLRP